jgi:hypothetical protein
MKYFKLFESFTSAESTNEAKAAVNEAATDLQSYVKKAADKCFTGGGNGENILQYGAEELAGHIDSYYVGPKNEDWIYTDKTAKAFMNFIDTMVEEEIDNNQVDEAVSEAKAELDLDNLYQYPQVVQAVIEDGGYEQITDKTKVKVGDNVLNVWNGQFGEIAKITGDKYKIVYDAWGDISQKNRANLQNSHLIQVKKKK